MVNMLWLVFMLSPLASAAVPSVGYNPGGFYPGGYGPQSGLGAQAAYPGYFPQQAYSQQVADGAEYRGGQGYRNFGQDARGKEIIRDAGALESRDSDGSRGGHFVARGHEGAGGYDRDAIGGSYNKAGSAASGSAAKYGAAGQGGYGGYGDEGHEKGHSTSGFHKTYHNIESGKNTKFIDEDHDLANQKIGHAEDAAYGNRGFGVRGQGHNQGLYAERVAQNAGARDASLAQGAQQAKYGAHDMNGYYHNQDLAYKRGQVLAEENRLARQGLHGMKANNGGVARFGQLW